ncbi:MAG: transglutaminase family protein [archaeon]
MKGQNLLLITILIAVPLTMFFIADYVLGNGFDESEAPSGFLTLAAVETAWDSYEYPFFSDIGIACGPDPFYSSPRVKSFEITDELAQLSYSLTVDADGELEKVYELFKYVSGNVLYATYTDNWRKPSEVLDTLDGDCTDKSILLVSLLSQIGVESYVVYGGENEYAEQHAWVVADINGDWFQMDATSKNFYYVYECREEENCIHSRFYNSILGVFGPEVSLKCEAVSE